ncbi:flagellar basal body-associated FliL family protein [Sphingobium boeckii]|uniref:Flagellar protein FliL n=1 Tax=Sphingobium boeckii TaxID=1082345 RepID=A0A7W9EEN8_9SPHN|nr:flagellar basal body-associated FliL family protein [Sphingobium boeckii]MBB5686448.1 flagellar FliL protein [Sphingobium boeckii]
MSDAPKEADAPMKKKGGGLKKIALLVAGVAILGGGGAVAGIYAYGSGLVGGGKDEAHKEDPNKPQLVMKENAIEHSGAAAAGKEKSKFQTSYYEIEKNFTANLADTDGFMQVSIGVSTNYDNRVIENLTKNEIPIRSAVLMTLSDQGIDAVATPEGKRQLLRALKVAINKALEEKEGFGGIDNVYFTNFVIQ